MRCPSWIDAVPALLLAMFRHRFRCVSAPILRRGTVLFLNEGRAPPGDRQRDWLRRHTACPRYMAIKSRCVEIACMRRAKI